jgi:uncharacterized membrane protein
VSLGDLAALYAICVVVFFMLDLVWLATATPRLYRPRLGDLLDPKPKLGVAAIFYLAYVVGVVALAVVPGLDQGSVVVALWHGALFGFLAYATYDLTNLATIRNWPWQISVVDMAWGTILNSLVAVAGYYAGVWLDM